MDLHAARKNRALFTKAMKKSDMYKILVGLPRIEQNHQRTLKEGREYHEDAKWMMHYIVEVWAIFCLMGDDIRMILRGSK